MTISPYGALLARGSDGFLILWSCTLANCASVEIWSGGWGSVKSSRDSLPVFLSHDFVRQQDWKRENQQGHCRLWSLAGNVMMILRWVNEKRIRRNVDIYVRLPGVFSTNRPHHPASLVRFFFKHNPVLGCCEECELVVVATIIAGPCAIPFAGCVAHNPISECQVESLLWGLEVLINVLCLLCPQPHLQSAPPPPPSWGEPSLGRFSGFSLSLFA